MIKTELRSIYRTTDAAALRNAHHEIMNKAQSERRDLTDEESAECDMIIEEMEMKQGSARIQQAESLDATSSPSICNALVAPKVQTWIGEDGKPVHVLNSTQKFSDLPDAKKSSIGDLTMGGVIRAMVTGRWERFAPQMLQESINTSGGYLVQSETSSQIIDLARAMSGIIRAGAVTIPMASDKLDVPRLITDSVLSVKGEGSTLALSEPSFDRIEFVALLLGCYLKISRELAEDSVGFESIIDNALAKALAAHIDKAALDGSGSAALSGLDQNSDIGSTASVAAIAYEDILTAAVDIQGNNFSPGSYIISPTIAGDLDALQSSGGGEWLGSPPGIVQDMNRVVTSNCANAKLYVGDWQNYALGIRQDAVLDATTTGGDAFKNHEVWVKITWRGCLRVLQAGAFHRLDGITT